jgi:hypothetical protein
VSVVPLALLVPSDAPRLREAATRDVKGFPGD